MHSTFSDGNCPAQLFTTDGRFQPTKDVLEMVARDLLTLKSSNSDSMQTCLQYTHTIFSSTYISLPLNFAVLYYIYFCVFYFTI